MMIKAVRRVRAALAGSALLGWINLVGDHDRNFGLNASLAAVHGAVTIYSSAPYMEKWTERMRTDSRASLNVLPQPRK